MAPLGLTTLVAHLENGNPGSDVARLMLWHFVETDKEFAAWRRDRVQAVEQKQIERS
jgi:hypothetical protein